MSSVVVAPGQSRRSQRLRRLAAQRTFVLGIVVLVCLVLLSLLLPQFIENGPLETNARNALMPPSPSAWFGTDDAGRDVLVRVLYAIRLDLVLAIIICVLATIAGTSIGLVSGWVGGTRDQIIMRGVDILMAFPSFILAITLAIILGGNERTVILALAIAFTPVAVRLVRSQVVTIREQPMIETSRAIGTPGWWIALYHVLPNTYGVVSAQATLFLAWAMLDIAGMSFIGVGISPPTPELGAMISQGANYMISGQWWVSAFPGIVLIIIVLAFNAIGDGIRDMLDPTRQ